MDILVECGFWLDASAFRARVGGQQRLLSDKPCPQVAGFRFQLMYELLAKEATPSDLAPRDQT